MTLLCLYHHSKVTKADQLALNGTLGGKQKQAKQKKERKEETTRKEERGVKKGVVATAALMCLSWQDTSLLKMKQKVGSQLTIVFFLLICKNSSHMQDTNLLTIMYLANIFSQPVAGHFILIMVSFDEWTLLILMQPNLSIFFSVLFNFYFLFKKRVRYFDVIKVFSHIDF